MSLKRNSKGSRAGPALFAGGGNQGDGVNGRAIDAIGQGGSQGKGGRGTCDWVRRGNSRNPASAAAPGPCSTPTISAALSPAPNRTRPAAPREKMCNICSSAGHPMYECSKVICTTCGGRGNWEMQCSTPPALLAASRCQQCSADFRFIGTGHRCFSG